MEIDQVFINREVWTRALAGDKEARAQVHKLIDGLKIYFHIIDFDSEKYIVVTLRELEDANLLDHVTLSATSR